jgi:hypothetical protein
MYPWARAKVIGFSLRFILTPVHNLDSTTILVLVSILKTCHATDSENAHIPDAPTIRETFHPI